MMYRTPMAKARDVSETSRPIHQQTANVLLKLTRVASDLAPVIATASANNKSFFRRMIHHVI